MKEMDRMPTLKKEKKKKSRASRLFVVFGWIFFISLSAVMFFQSPLSKVDEVIVEGAKILERTEVEKLSQVRKGQSFFTVKTPQIEESVRELPAVKEVDVKRSFPGKVIISITEYEHVAFHWDDQKNLIPVLEDGTRLENTIWGDRVIDRPIIRNWADLSLLPQLADELKKVEPSIRNEISEIESDPELEPQRLILYMKDGFEVRTSLRQFAKNMDWYPPFVANLKQEGSAQGIIMLLDGKWFVPYPETGIEEGA